MLVAAILQVETLPRAKTAGVMIATVGVHRSWLGPFGSVARRYVDDRSRALYGLLQCLVEGIGKAIRSDRICGPRLTFGALVLVVLAWMRGGFAATESFGPIQWSDVGFLGIFGGALTFLLWSYALERTTPTRVAISVTVNPDCVRDLRGLCTGRADHGQSRTRPPTRCNRNFGCILNAERDDGPDVVINQSVQLMRLN